MVFLLSVGHRFYRDAQIALFSDTLHSFAFNLLKQIKHRPTVAISDSRCYLLYLLQSERGGGAVAQRVERWTCDQQIQILLRGQEVVMFCGWEGNHRLGGK